MATSGLDSRLKLQAAEATAARNLILKLNHSLLVTGRVRRVLIKSPLEELIGVVGLEALVQDTKPLAVLGNLGPVALNVLQIMRKVGKAALKDLAVQVGAHDGLEIDVLLPSLLRVLQHKVGRLLDGLHELAHLVRVLGDEGLVADVQDGAEAAASQLGELVDAKHLHVRLGAALSGEPLLELDHLDVLQTDAGIDGALDDGLGDVHAAAHGGVLVGRHAVVRCQLVDLDLAELADIADALALEGAEVGGDARVLEVDNSGEGLVEQTADGQDGEVTSLGLSVELVWYTTG